MSYQTRANSGPAGKLARLGRYFDLLAFLDEEGNADFHAGLSLASLVTLPLEESPRAPGSL